MKKIFSSEFLNFIKEANVNFKTILFDFLVSLALSIALILKRDRILNGHLSTILIIIACAFVANFLNNLYKTHLKKVAETNAKKIAFSEAIHKIVRNYGKEFDKLLNDKVRTTVYQESVIDGQLYLVIANRFNSYVGDPQNTRWKISHLGSNQCEGIAGQAWSEKVPIRKPRLLGKVRLNALLRSDTQEDIASLNEEMEKQNISRAELEKRVALPDRPYLFPTLMYAVGIDVHSEKRLVVVIDSDKKSTVFKDEFTNKVDEFGLVLSSVWRQL